MVYKLYPKIYLLCKVGYAHYKGLYGLFFMLQLFILMYYSNKCQLFCTHEQSVGGKRGGMVCKSLLKPVNNDCYDATRDQPIMVLVLLIMLCCSALKIYLLCSVLCSRTKIVVRLLCYSYTILHVQFTTSSRQFYKDCFIGVY